ncbi:putative membrane protein [Curtobacterium pusillum]|uniref:Membrane protein n=1 Tax=Curtobacterium pusillum TaxID=69373 RepID=A0AAW3T930_9MICO|nr:DUF1648 domain-containing protein [Curtobacterium pusillum]MBA8991603.1 putative membrane protein [Curtobacterium pusillum]
MTTRTMGTGARLAVVVPSVVLAIAVGLVAATVGPTLPARVATHFDADGTPNGWGSPWTTFWIAAAVVVVAVVLAVSALRLRDRRTAATLVLVVNALAAPLAVVWIAVALTNTTGDPTMPWWWLAVVLGAMLAVTVPPVTALVRSAGPVPAYDVEPLAVGPDARVAWRARIGSGWFAALGVVSVLVGVWATWVTAQASTGTAVLTGALLVLAGLAVMALARVECTVDRRGLRLTSTWTRIPIMRVPLDRIESCGWEQVSPGQWGGWGYRISGRGVAYVVRSGPGLVARLRGGGARMVTVADAERGAAALGALLAARGSS